MILAQGRYWHVARLRGASKVGIEIQKASLPEDLYDLKDLKFEVPLAKWSLVFKNIHSDRKRLGGLLLDFAKDKDRVGAAVSSDPLLVEFRRVVVDATIALVEDESLTLVRVDSSADDA